MEDEAGPGLRFEVLGPLRAWRGDSAIDLGPLQQRVVLAVLLVQAGRPIGREQVITAVWGEEPPSRAVNLVQRHVSGLRRVLGVGRPGPQRPARLVWTDAGYQLTLPAGALDLELFEAGLSRSRAARTIGDSREAAEALHSALALWRGPFCHGLSSPFVDAQRDRLAESRVGVIEERVELDLALGHHGDLVSELRGLVAEHPLRERLQGLLMLALYRAGRQADALAAYRNARRHLQEELGVEPAAPLQRLHQQILAADPELGQARTETAFSGGGEGYRRPVPAQLPHSIPDFTGREAEFGMLNALLPGEQSATGGPVVIAAITGTAGVGKSALAVNWGQQIRDRFPDGQLYINLRGFGPAGSAMEASDVIRGFLDAFEVPATRIPLDLESQGALYRSVLAPLRVLIVLDNARDAPHVRPLLPGSPGCLVVVTSRNQLIDLAAADGAHLVSLDLLSADEAQRLLARRLSLGRVTAEPAAVCEVIGACAGLPLALSVVAARAAANPRVLLAGLAEELQESRGGLDALDAGESQTNVRAVFSWSYHALSPPAARLFRLLGLHAGPDVGVSAAASLAAEAPVPARALLAELTRAHLLTESGHGRFAFHDLLRAYASELADAHDPAADKRAAVHRVLDHYLHTAYRADELLRPGREDAIALAPVTAGVAVQRLADRRKALSWLDIQYQNLLAALRQAVAEGFDVHTWQLAWTLASYFDRRWHWHDALTYLRLALVAARRLGDLRGQAASHGCLAYACISLGRDDEAQSHLAQAYRLYEELGDKTGQAHAHLRMARVLDNLRHYAPALEHSQQSVELFRAAGQRTGEGRALNAVGWFHVRLGEPEQGLVHLQQALALQREIGDEFSQADTLDSIAAAYLSLGRHGEAAAHYRQAMDLYREFGDRYPEADTWASLGDTYLAADDSESAVGAWRNALAILDDLGHPDAEGIRTKLAMVEGMATSILTGTGRRGTLKSLARHVEDG
jgi:DNA-binding SARP family transcriptional activator/tetratricopeptide (TPR) repeat protein